MAMTIRRPAAIQLPLIPEDELPPGRDRVPELTHYRDEGCRHWEACLTCPFPRCVLEVRGLARRLDHAARDAEIRRRHAAGEPAISLATHFKIARRTVYRVLGGIRKR